MHVNKNYFSIKSFNNKNLTHGFFTRIGGYSKRKLKSLNCSLSNNDNKKIVIKNRSLALKKLQLEEKKLILLNQTHSSKVIRINKKNQHKKVAAVSWEARKNSTHQRPAPPPNTLRAA